jgi:hypothetical protein
MLRKNAAADRWSLTSIVAGTAAVAAIGARGLHFRDLRHTRKTLEAEGAGIKDLMTRLGRSEPAAMIYQHPGARGQSDDHWCHRSQVEAERTWDDGDHDSQAKGHDPRAIGTQIA